MTCPTSCAAVNHPGLEHEQWAPLVSVCHHCGQSISDQLPGPSHLTGANRWLSRCATTDSGQQYGYTAHPVGTACPGHCLGSDLEAAAKLAAEVGAS